MTQRNYHKWGGLVLCFFLIMFSFSGIILNHRNAFKSCDVSRSLLPSSYQFKNWNNGAVKASLKINSDSILLYGNAGIWLTDSLQSFFKPFMQGLPKGADSRTILRIVRTDSKEIFAISNFASYHLESDKWTTMKDLQNIKERLCDMESFSDSLLIISRSDLFVSTYPFDKFQKVELKAPKDYQAKTSLFRTVWLLHSGELFGLGGKIIVDLLGVILIILSVTGIVFFVSRTIGKKKEKKSPSFKFWRKQFNWSLIWHNRFCRYSIYLLLLLVLSGTFLRPPLLIAIIKFKIPNPPLTTLSSKNAWHDKLRVIRKDKNRDKWVLYTSSGFYSLNGIRETPVKMDDMPPVSVMGLNALEIKGNEWLVGSFSGLFSWNEVTKKQIDLHTGKKPEKMGKIPVLKHPISGISRDFGDILIWNYIKGASFMNSSRKFASMPAEISNVPMSLWNVSLEIHTGRIYKFLGPVEVLYIFIVGTATFILLITGWNIYKKRYRKKSPKRK